MQVSDVYEAKLAEEIGLKQPVAYTEDERQSVATHEAGHATVAHFLGTTRRLEVLSIIKRRSSLGLLAHGDLEERWTQSKTELEATMAIALGGLASEELFFGESGTGPASDLSTATEVAAMMVGALGMGGSLVSYEAVSEGPISTKNLVGKVLASGEGKRKVEELLDAQKQRALEVLETNRHVVEALRDALLERDELIGDEITDVIRAAVERA
jgi:ATP-dependent Zn protease